MQSRELRGGLEFSSPKPQRGAAKPTANSGKVQKDKSSTDTFLKQESVCRKTFSIKSNLIFPNSPAVSLCFKFIYIKLIYVQSKSVDILALQYLLE